MTSSATTTQLGRHLWGSIRESAAALSARFPGRRPLPKCPSVGNFLLFNTPHRQNTRPFHSARRFFQPHPSHISPRNHIFDEHRRDNMYRSGGLGTGGRAGPESELEPFGQADMDQESAGQGRPGVCWEEGQQLELKRRGRQEQGVHYRREARRAAAKSPTTPSPHASENESLAESMSKYLHLPKMPHRPTKEELLAAASGFGQRLKVRFKWFSIRSMRPWNADEWGAFVSWFLFGHIVWILVGTTTFFSLIILFINTVFAQETLAKWIGDYLTHSAGLTVVFESAIVPKWKDGVITFRNVFVSRRPGQVRSSVKKGSSNAAAEAAAARKADQELAVEEEDDGNYTQFDVTIDTVNVTLSFLKWWNGKGLLKDVEVKGVRGVVDRTSVRWDDVDRDPLSYRHEHNPGDFELDYFKLEDLLVTVHQPGGFRPFSVSIFSCELPQLRKQWLFYDFLSASHMSGSFDGSLFTIHPRQIHGTPSAAERRQAESDEASAWKKFSRLRIDGLKIDHLNRGVEGPFGWIYEGNVDIVADIMFPPDPAEGIGKVVAGLYDKMEEAVTSNRYLKILEQSSSRNRRPEIDVIDNSTSGIFYDRNHNHDDNSNNHDDTAAAPPLESGPPPIPPPSIPTTTPASLAAAAAISQQQHDGTQQDAADAEAPSYLVMDMRIHLNNVRAAVPLFNNPHISYVNQALVRPIVAYINAKRTYIPINCRIVKRVADFDGAWSVWDCGLMDDTGAEVYAAFARDVEDQQNRVRRFKRVGLWTVSLVVHALLAGVAGDLM
ncbi:84402523-4481-4488-a893-16c6cd1ff137 [Thermothielavioides terrestris]|uniref:84402523-4481-4488-a893-16c6cd1ff137 n=1 Tax=Thermothielavioides terrestris TaxID=2587410 RepID=A0A446BMT2_9PEZI|nr:84402523-4481-4488-a893-16c6cd1ff137 [Thermothielavioides terrestris]